MIETECECKSQNSGGCSDLANLTLLYCERCQEVSLSQRKYGNIVIWWVWISLHINGCNNNNVQYVDASKRRICRCCCSIESISTKEMRKNAHRLRMLLSQFSDCNRAKNNKAQNNAIMDTFNTNGILMCVTPSLPSERKIAVDAHPQQSRWAANLIHRVLFRTLNSDCCNNTAHVISFIPWLCHMQWSLQLGRFVTDVIKLKQKILCQFALLISTNGQCAEGMAPTMEKNVNP